jgi:hypothetical protein
MEKGGSMSKKKSVQTVSSKVPLKTLQGQQSRGKLITSRPSLPKPLKNTEAPSIMRGGGKKEHYLDDKFYQKNKNIYNTNIIKR